MVDCKEKNRIKYDDFLKKEILIIYMLNLGKTNNQILPKILNFRDISLKKLNLAFFDKKFSYYQ